MDYRAHVLGIEARGERGRSDQIGEQDGQLPAPGLTSTGPPPGRPVGLPIARQRLLELPAATAAEPGALRVLGAANRAKYGR
jgi:hypothetical protein